MKSNRKKLFVCTTTAVAMFAGVLSTQAKDSPENPKSKLKVGTCDLQTAFLQHPAQKELEKTTQTAQSEFKAAQQEGDQQKLQQIQQQFEQSRQKILAKYQQDVDKAMSTAAKAADVKVVAEEITYTAEDVETMDITSQLIKTFDGAKEDTTAAAPEKSKSQSKLKLGTYDAQMAFQQHPAQKELEKTVQSMQTQMQKAQQEGDQQKLQQIQQEFEQTRGKAINKFLQDLKEIMPTAAKAAGVKVAASEVSYTAKDVESKDITTQLIAAFEGQQKRDTPNEQNLIN